MNCETIEKEKCILLTDSHIAHIGRTTFDDNTLKIGWSGSGFELAVRGGTVKVSIKGTAASLESLIWFAVYLNGKRIKTIALQDDVAEWYVLAENLPSDSVNSVKVIRLTEPNLGIAVLEGICVTGELVTPVLPKRRILCIGDSITCGFGALGNSDDIFSSKTEDATLTYGWLLSEEFNAQLHIISVSGYGVVVSNTGSTVDILPNIYPYSILGEAEKWDHNRYQPDLILVNLGTNDETMRADPKFFRSGIKSFITTLRTLHPNAEIVWLYGIMHNDYMPYVRDEVVLYSQRDDKVHFIPVGIATNENELGSVRHPSAAAHKRLANEIKTKITEIMIW